MHLIYTTDKGECRFLKIHITGIEENGEEGGKICN
jgi:hypothetical protein